LLTVLDEGPGLPAGFNPANSKGLGMRIVQAFVEQIGAGLRFGLDRDGLRASITIVFHCPQPGIHRTQQNVGETRQSLNDAKRINCG
jgi:hypothetical protein